MWFPFYYFYYKLYLLKCQYKGEKMNLFDSHSHYNDEKFDIDREQIIKETLVNGVSNFIVAGYNIEGSKKAVRIAENYEQVYTTAGISPNDVEDIKYDVDESISQIEEIAKNKKVVAIGEIGLDYYWNKENKELQKEVFIKQIELANKLDLPIVIHTRDAFVDTIEILKQNNVNKKGIFHCCPLNQELIKEAIKLGYYISLSGVITFKNAKNVEEILSLIPADKLLIETDSPYLSPEPFRGTRNNSMNVKYVAEKIANLKNKTTEEIAELTNQNAKRIFEIK